MNVWTSSFERGSRPVVGSSRRRSEGLVSRARAIATFCCMPRLICSIGRPTRFSRDAEPGEDLDRLALRLAGVQAVEPGREEEVLHRAELLEEGGVDADPVDQPLDRHLVALDVVAEDLDPALVERQQAADEADEGRLAGAVRAEDPVDVAALEAERHVRDRRHGLALSTDREALRDADRSGAPARRTRCTTTPTLSTTLAVFGCLTRVAVTGLELLERCGVPGRRRGGPGMRKAAGPADVLRRRGGPRGLDAGPGGRASKKPGARLAHGSWFASGAVLPPQC